jgi:hypothetical protein
LSGVAALLGGLLSPSFINYPLVLAESNSFIIFSMLKQLWSSFGSLPKA